MISKEDPTKRESNGQFESRKADHIRLSLSDQNQAIGLSGLDRLDLIHEALPDLDFDQVTLQTKSIKQKLETPFFISAMTAGHEHSGLLNRRLAQAAQAQGWRMGVGSQRRELNDPQAAREWKEVRRLAPKAIMIGNIGLAQLIESKVSEIERLVDNLEASLMAVHLNALQECLQPEGTPRFKGGLRAIEALVKKLSVPVVVKETGCGMSANTLKRLKGLGVAGVDISGLGGTHWGRIEGERNPQGDERKRAAMTLADWGIATVESVCNAIRIKPDYEVWASGGVRSGLDAAKLLSLGAKSVGFAKPILEGAMRGDEELRHVMRAIEFELKTVLFCSGCKDIKDFQAKKVWTWRTR